MDRSRQKPRFLMEFPIKWGLGRCAVGLTKHLYKKNSVIPVYKHLREREVFSISSHTNLLYSWKKRRTP